MREPRFQRVRRFLECAHVLTEPGHALREQALRVLPEATGLSLQNIVWALDNALEVNATDAELSLLCARTPEAARAHVLLSANVFVAALRAIAIGLTCAPKVIVRPSRREPEMLRLLAQAAPEQFAIVEALEPSFGDHFWAYGGNETMAELKRNLLPGVILHAHGNGFGIAVLEANDLATAAAVDEVATGLAVDVAAFDQRGCLSPRLVLVQGSMVRAEELCQALAKAMSEREQLIPMGPLAVDERAQVRRFRDTMYMVGSVLPAGSGLVTLETEPRGSWILPPVGRVLHVRRVTDAVADLRPHISAITTVGVAKFDGNLAAQFNREFPSVRVAHVGQMQCPALDGPVDLRDLAGLG
jgi:hypothetical protein